MRVIFAGVLLFGVLVLGVLVFLSNGTVLTVDPPVKVVGLETPLRIVMKNPHGVRRLTVWMEQDGARHEVFEATETPVRFAFWKQPRREPREITVPVGKSKAAGLKDGKALLVVEAKSNDLRARTDRVSMEVQVNTQPPRVVADGHQHYINQGGAELVVFTATGYWTEAGVKVGPYKFRSFPLPGGSPGQRFSLFGFPWDVPAGTQPLVYASNPAGAEAIATFWNKIFPKKFRARELPLDDKFLMKVVGELDPSRPVTEGNLLERFLKINGEMRKRDNQALADMRLKTVERFLWTGPFVQLSNSQVESQFADRRSYLYQGKKVDEQVHLGFDLSVTQNYPIAAANDGAVLHAAPLGIYGDCVVIDHGYGLQSIYGHLSSIAVKVGDAVKKGQAIGRSGSTGLAGGDHLHFSMQLDGVQINPVEWWDEHWLQDRVWSKVRPPNQQAKADRP